MAVSVSDVEAKALALLGGAAGDGEKTAVAAVAAAAKAELEGRLRDGVSAEALGETFVTACGMLALALCLETGTGGDVRAFSAGSLSVTMGGGEGMSAARLRAQAEKLLSAYLADGGFAFLGVRG